MGHAAQHVRGHWASGTRVGQQPQWLHGPKPAAHLEDGLDAPPPGRDCCAAGVQLRLQTGRECVCLGQAPVCGVTWNDGRGWRPGLAGSTDGREWRPGLAGSTDGGEWRL